MIKLRCVTCGQIMDKAKGLYTCPTCGRLLGTLEVLYDYGALNLKRSDFSPDKGVFQFAALLPVTSHTPIDHAVGATPFLTFKDIFGMKKVMVKYDGTALSASYKDRASVMAMNLAIEEGYDTIYCASTGNAAASLAILTAHSPLKTVIFVPSTIPLGKLAQLQAAGADVCAVEGTYDDAFDLSMEIGFQKGWYCRNSAVNPYLLEGKKTGAYEILVQNNFEAPDFCLVGVGDGTVISALIKGFEEFKKVGLVDRIPRVIGVQAQGASTLKKVFEKGEPFTPIRESVDTIADSISVGAPRDVIKACQYMRRNGGRFVDVTDEAIAEAIFEMSQKTGLFPEPAGAVPLAGLKKCLEEGIITPNDEVVLVVTGNGLKDLRPVQAKVTLKPMNKKAIQEKWLGGTS